ncbi:hypothetical protein hmeg3_24465 [Herbaspirillum sp. meg3]|uniref:PepSY-associated TM helix domain-containing protein n=1 Tax=Herbaspirillum sp. meg3 TaxID=2025949 RepID=UPI000B9867DB|nr:PepSY-associated TM helix domain-containing protein [Herbaspirillum sp. meg3]ASU41142.1 hypothetical protein hmeg3_24465 [Herbaspirillum sp. meg3]
MREGFRQSMAWLHTWSGLLVCWVLFLVFCAGTASYFREEITLWMKPELHASHSADIGTAQAAQVALTALQAKAPEASRWFITLPAERSTALRIGWISPPPKDAPPKTRGKFTSQIIDPLTGDKMPDVRETRGGEFLYRLHFDLHYMPPLWARWIVGFCAMFMLVAIVSGVITHKRIFKDFFTFRPKKGQRSWLDAHNATAVLALPYHLMITYTGLVTLMFMYMPWGIQTAYKGNQDSFFADVFPSAKNGKAAGKPMPLTPLQPLLAQAEQRWHGMHAVGITINHPGDANATIQIRREEEKGLNYIQPSVQYNGVTGALISADGEDIGGANATRGVLYGLHIGHFANPLLRVLFFLCGLTGCAMVATGALLWAVKTRQSHAKKLAQGGHIGAGFGLRLVEALNIGAIAGLPIAFAAYFWANRLLPVAMEKRPDAEMNWFFIAWGIAAVLAQIRPDRRMWQWQLWVGALLFMGIPVLNVFTTSSHLGVTLFMAQGPWPVAGFDLTVLALGIGLAFAAWHLGRKKKAVKKIGKAHSHNDADNANDAKLQEAA